MHILEAKGRLTAHFKKSDMWRRGILPLLFTLLLGSQVTRCEDVASPEADAFAWDQQENTSDISAVLGKTRHHILAAQFECYLKIINDPPRVDEGSYCNRTWDGWLCWGDSAPGTVIQMCPEYFLDFDPAEKVTKVCNADGRWFHHPESNRVWSNYTQCSIHTKDKLKFAISLYYLAMVGHGLSIVSLIVCLVIFSYFKSLSCQRISLHKNTFLSFILNSVVTIMWLSLTVANNQTINARNPVSCKVLAVLTQYTSTSSYFWMLCEGIYLHTLIIVAVFVGEQQLFWYYVLGWGFPIVPAITYAVARGFFFNDKCWISAHTHLLYIIHGPIQAALLGLLVAIIFCFCNGEAQTALKRKWSQWKSAWGKTGWGDTPANSNSHFSYHNNSSITETSRVTVNAEQPDAHWKAGENARFLSGGSAACGTDETPDTLFPLK
ncbi:calcitonin gene-related peptide type 1 receptor-like isoform X2 [Nerophis lumbriciformis]|uniref:calcitonin gene-related peptide type 1 receptor-like isoform X2 n=1 Tax=Nerophis lumbriciformis TaxID=546530 RepID=UPI003BA89E76